VAVARNERPSQPNAGGGAMNRAPQQQHEMHNMAPPARPSPQPQPPQQHFNGGGGGGQPRPQMAPRQEAPHPQQSAPRPEVRRGGGEPNGQGGGRPQPQARGPGEHGRR
jgi:hypothetical protein